MLLGVCRSVRLDRDKRRRSQGKRTLSQRDPLGETRKQRPRRRRAQGKRSQGRMGWQNRSNLALPAHCWLTTRKPPSASSESSNPSITSGFLECGTVPTVPARPIRLAGRVEAQGATSSGLLRREKSGHPTPVIRRCAKDTAQPLTSAHCNNSVPLPLPVFNRSNDLTEDRLPARSHAIARQEKSFWRGHEELFGKFGGFGMAGHVVLQLVASTS